MKPFRIALALYVTIVCGCGRTNERLREQTESASATPSTTDGSLISREDPDLRSILDQIVTIVLKSPDLPNSRESYGTVGDSRCALVSDGTYGIPWPS